jgi:hypothetical protein
MITLFTGVPGMGKTALIVSMMLDELKKGDRPFFVMGIPELKLDHSPVPPVKEWTELRPDKDDPSILLPYFTFPPNSIIIIDEAQRVFRPRASASKVPDHVAANETHRHTGVDFWLLTQKPSLLDSNVRELVGRHIHLKDTLLGRKLYEWREYADVKSKENLREAASRKFRPPKEAFQYYKSSELHTKQPYRVHQAFYLLAGLAIFLTYNGYGLYDRMFKKKDPSPSFISESQATDAQTTIKPIEKPKQEQPIQSVALKPTEPLHPYMGFDFVIKGTIRSKSYNATYYELTSQNRHVSTTDIELKKLGYEINQPNDCSAFLFFHGAQVIASCTPSQTENNDLLKRYNKPLHANKEQIYQPAYTPTPLIDGNDFPPSPA